MDYENVHIHKVNGATSFVGVKIYDNKINIFVPNVFRYNETNLKESMPDIIKFLKSISLAKTKKKVEILSSKKGEKNELIWDIEAYLWLINDYLDNGLFYTREKIYVNDGNGKIDWKRTLKKIPVITNENIVYLELVTNKVAPTNSLISQVYKYCLDLSLRRIGWVFNYNFKIQYERTMSIKEMVYIVKKELSSTYDDIKRLRFKHMLSILEGASDDYNTINKHTYGVDHYYYVFEKMVDTLFGNINDNQKNIYNPPTYWVIGDAERKKAPLEPDTIHNIYKNDIKYTYILDSKMYGYGYSANFKDLPGSQSIQKQITYGDYVKNVIEKGKNIKIRNVFILPYNMYDNPFIIGEKIYFFGLYLFWEFQV